MTQDNLIKLSQPGAFSDLLTDVLRNGARALLAQAVEAEAAGFLGGHAAKLTDDGRARLVRHGHLPEREIMTGIGPVAVRASGCARRPRPLSGVRWSKPTARSPRSSPSPTGRSASGRRSMRCGRRRERNAAGCTKPRMS